MLFHVQMTAGGQTTPEVTCVNYYGAQEAAKAFRLAAALLAPKKTVSVRIRREDGKLFQEEP